MPGTAAAASTLVKRDSGPEDDLVGRGQGASTTSAGATGSSGTSETSRIPPVPMTATWPATGPLFRVGLEQHRVGRGRQDPAPDAEQTARLVERGDGVLSRVHQAGQDQIAQGVPGQLLLGEASGEGRPGSNPVRPEPPCISEGHPGGMTPSSSRRRPHDPPSSATETTAVTPVGVAPDGPQGRSQAVTRHPAPPPRVRRTVAGPSVRTVTGPRPDGRPRSGCPCLSRRRASSSARATERCRPPVHPMATVRYDLPSRT